MVTVPPTHIPTHRQDRLQYTAPQLARSVKNENSADHHRVILSLHFCICLYVCVFYAFVPHLVSQHIDNLFSLWAASIDKHKIASLAARHCAFFLCFKFVSLTVHS